MKKILIFICILIFSGQICFAQDNVDENFEQYFETTPETVNDSPQNFQGGIEYNEAPASDNEDENIYLDNDDIIYKQIDFSKPKQTGSENFAINKQKPAFYPFDSNLSTASKFKLQEYDLGKTDASLSKQFGNFSFGTKYNSALDDNSQVTYTTALFSKYESRHFAFTTTFLKSTGYDYASYNDKIRLAPELKLTKRLSLLNIMQTDVQQIKKSNEIVLRYKPNFKKYADDVELEFGAGQSFYNENFVKSSLRFSTNFRL